jgi:hypothetical protein
LEALAAQGNHSTSDWEGLGNATCWLEKEIARRLLRNIVLEELVFLEGDKLLVHPNSNACQVPISPWLACHITAPVESIDIAIPIVKSSQQ